MSVGSPRNLLLFIHSFPCSFFSVPLFHHMIYGGKKDVMGDKLPHDWQWAQGQLRNHIRGNIVGFDFAGVVQETTADQRFQTGDKVFGNMPPMEGTLAEYISVPLDQICHAPANLSLKHVAAFPLVGLTAVQSLSPCVREGKSVLVVGASGGAGHVGLQAARNLGASHVTAVCSSRNENFVKKFGATHFVDYTLNDSDPDTLYDNLKNAPGNPYHVVLDCVTSEDPRDRVIDYPDLIRRGGKAKKSPLVTEDHTYLRLGGPSPDWVRAALEKAGLPWWPDKHEKLFWIRFPKSSGELKQLQEWAQDGKLDVQVSRTVPFTAEDVKGAFDQILERRVQGKMVVEVMAEE